MHRVLEVEMGGQRRQVIGVVVHVMAVSGLGGKAMSASIVGDYAKPVVKKEQHLRVPVIRRQRPAVRETDRLSRAPIRVLNLYSVFRCNRSHRGPPLPR